MRQRSTVEGHNNKCTWKEDQGNTAKVPHGKKQTQHNKLDDTRLMPKLEGVKLPKNQQKCHMSSSQPWAF